MVHRHTGGVQIVKTMGQTIKKPESGGAFDMTHLKKLKYLSVPQSDKFMERKTKHSERKQKVADKRKDNKVVNGANKHTTNSTNDSTEKLDKRIKNKHTASGMNGVVRHRERKSLNLANGCEQPPQVCDFLLLKFHDQW